MKKKLLKRKLAEKEQAEIAAYKAEVAALKEKLEKKNEKGRGRSFLSPRPKSLKDEISSTNRERIYYEKNRSRIFLFGRTTE